MTEVVWWFLEGVRLRRAVIDPLGQRTALSYGANCLLQTVQNSRDDVTKTPAGNLPESL